MSNVNSFDVLKRMSAENMDIRLAPSKNVIRMQKVNAGTQITIGVEGDVISGILNNELNACLLIFSMKQFDETKKKMEDGQ